MDFCLNFFDQHPNGTQGLNAQEISVRINFSEKKALSKARIQAVQECSMVFCFFFQSFNKEYKFVKIHDLRTVQCLEEKKRHWVARRFFN